MIALRGAGAGEILAKFFGDKLPQANAITRGWIAEDGRRIDEALLWRVEDGFEIGLHGGAAATTAVLRAFRRAGVRVESTPDHSPGSIEADAAALLPRAATLPAAMFLAAAAEGALSREMACGDPARLRALLDRAAAGAALAVPRTVVLSGPPNAGKSTLLNALSGRDRALVHPEAGTTRDPVEAMADFEGYPVRLLDTAGLAGAQAGVGAEAEARAREAIAAADLVLWLADPVNPVSPEGRADLRLSGKSDLGPAIPGAIPVSGATAAGLDALRQSVLRALGLPFPAEARPAPFRAEHVRAIEALLRPPRP
ncbi:MAG: 50S ribosome-binding GTPase [Planctomycetes bacterium]|nr:50S ribosome-binding GTPase [Planctomycetota bacterium]